MKINKSKEQLIFEQSKEYKSVLDDIRDHTRVSSEARMANLYDTAKEATQRDPYAGRNFYLVLVITNDPGNYNKPVDRIFVRLSCPTPGYNQVVYKYHKDSGALEYLWTIPKKHIYHDILRRKADFLSDKDTKKLASFVLMMESGQLLEWVKKENGEKPDAIISVKQAEA